jgi:cellulose 1,4-beta-cellobiosidase
MPSILERAARALGAVILLSACAHPGDGSDESNDGVLGGTGSGGASGFANSASGGTTGAMQPGSNAGSDNVAGSGNDGMVAGGGGGGSSSSGNTGTGGAPADNSGGSGGMSGDNGMTGGVFVTAGDWHGYAWSSANGMGTTIDPPTFMGVMEGDPLCISGTVAPATDFSGIAMIGVNVNQERIGMDTPHPVKTGQAGLLVNVTNRGSAQLRVQIQGENGASDENDRWCVPLSGSGGFYTWGSFNSKCWDNTGNDYAGEDIVAVMVTVPGDDTDPVSYDFCLNSFMQADSADGGGNDDGAGDDTVDPGDNSGSGTLTMPLEWKPVMRDGRNYVVQNNVWGGSSQQTVTYDGTTFEVTQQTGSNSTSAGPVSYPSAFIGSNNSRNTAGANLPKQVSALGTIDTGFSHNAGSVGGTYNAAYDVWFSTGSGGDAGSPSGGYLMVWLYDPDDAQPIGTRVDTNVSIDGASGSWDIWLGQNGGKPCISYVRTEATTSLKFDLNQFIQHAVGRGDVQSSWYLTNVFAGFEIWSGGVALKTNAFYALVN